jgi:hypothetical protein
MDKIEIICLRTDAYYALFEQLLNHFKDREKHVEDKWISGPEAMKMLRIKSKGTLQKLRDEGKIRYTQPEKKIILYDLESIHAYLDDFVYEPFDLPKNKR